MAYDPKTGRVTSSTPSGSSGTTSSSGKKVINYKWDEGRQAWVNPQTGADIRQETKVVGGRMVSTLPSSGATQAPVQGPVQQSGQFYTGQPTSTIKEQASTGVSVAVSPLKKIASAIATPYNIIQRYVSGDTSRVSGSYTEYGLVGAPSRIRTQETEYHGRGVRSVATTDVRVSKTVVPVSVQGPTTQSGDFFSGGSQRPVSAVRTDWIGEARGRTSMGGTEYYQEIDTRKPLTTSLQRTGVFMPSEDIYQITGAGRGPITGGIYEGMKGVIRASESRIDTGLIKAGVTDARIRSTVEAYGRGTASYLGMSENIKPQRLEVFTEFGTGALVGLRQKSTTAFLTTVATMEATKLIGGSTTLQALISKYPKSTLVGSYGVATMYGASVGARAAFSERPAYTLGRITTTEAIPLAVGVSLGRTALTFPKVSEPLYTTGKVKFAGADLKAVRFRYMPKDTVFVARANVSPKYYSVGVARLGSYKPGMISVPQRGAFLNMFEAGRITTTKGSLTYATVGDLRTSPIRGDSFGSTMKATWRQGPTGLYPSGIGPSLQQLPPPQYKISAPLKAKVDSMELIRLERLANIRKIKPIKPSDVQLYSQKTTPEGMVMLTVLSVPEPAQQIQEGKYNLPFQKSKFKKLKKMFDESVTEKVTPRQTSQKQSLQQVLRQELSVGMEKSALQNALAGTTRNELSGSTARSVGATAFASISPTQATPLSQQPALAQKPKLKMLPVVIPKTLPRQYISPIMSITPALKTSISPVQSTRLSMRYGFPTLQPVLTPPPDSFSLSWGAGKMPGYTKRGSATFTPKVTPSVAGAAFKVKGKRPSKFDIFAGIKARPLF